MSNPSDRFACRWQPSRCLLLLYAAGQGLALAALAWLDVGTLERALGVLCCVGHAAWAVPRSVSLDHPRAWRQLRRIGPAWELYNQAGGWQGVQLQPDSVAWPGLVVLRFRLPGQWFSRSVCLPADSLPAEQHRRLRVRLRFSRSRWAAAQ